VSRQAPRRLGEKAGEPIGIDSVGAQQTMHHWIGEKLGERRLGGRARHRALS
jgi:hypothetical protein